MEEHLTAPARTERWVMRLQPYRFVVKYRSGKTNIADCLLRLTQIKTEKSHVLRRTILCS